VEENLLSVVELLAPPAVERLSVTADDLGVVAVVLHPHKKNHHHLMEVRGGVDPARRPMNRRKNHHHLMEVHGGVDPAQRPMNRRKKKKMMIPLGVEVRGGVEVHGGVVAAHPLHRRTTTTPQRRKNRIMILPHIHRLGGQLTCGVVD
jgi:hypothetical protein